MTQGDEIVDDSNKMLELYKKHPSLKPEDIQQLKEWLKKQHHLPSVTDHQIAVFIFSCQYSLEQTKSCIDAYFTVKTSVPEFFRQRDVLCAELKQISSVVDIVPLTATSPEGYRYILGRLKDFDASQFNLNAAVKLLFMVIDAAMRCDDLVPGVVFIYDMKGVVFQHVTRISPVSVKKYIVYLAEAMPVRLKSLHILNVNSVINSIMAIMKPFLNSEQLKVIHFHSGEAGMEEFFQDVPCKIMPSDYGGSDESVQELMSKCHQQLVSYREWFAESERYKVDESKRDGKSKSAGSFGLDGSFKKLDID